MAGTGKEEVVKRREEDGNWVRGVNMKEGGGNRECKLTEKEVEIGMRGQELERRGGN